MYKTKLIEGTSNRKLTNLKYDPYFSSSYTTFESCSDACPLWKKCYGKKGFTAIHERKLFNSDIDYDLEKFINDIERLRPNTTLRLNITGDLPCVTYKPNNNERKISIDALTKIYHATKKNNIKTYTYTHLHCDYKNQKHNLDCVKLFSTDNFVINLSTEKPLQASKYFVDKFDVVMTNSKVFDLAVDAIKKGNKPTMVNKYGTIDIFPCKALYMDNESCSTCRKCMEHNRKEVVIFKEH